MCLFIKIYANRCIVYFFFPVGCVFVVQRDYQKVNIQKTEQHEKSPTSQSPKFRTADRTKKEKMGFLDERPSFQPNITRKVPDFSKLHKALQTVGMKKTQTKDMTKCQPFHLRTSTLPVRQNRTSPQSSQVKHIEFNYLDVVVM